jgi:hypothetical protein
MAHAKLGLKEEARKWYDEAAKAPDKEEELQRLRAEAAQLLGIPDRP